MDSDFTLEDRGGSEEERIRSLIDQALGRAAHLGYTDGDSFEALMALGDALFGAVNDVIGICPEELHR